MHDSTIFSTAVPNTQTLSQYGTLTQPGNHITQPGPHTLSQPGPNTHSQPGHHHTHSQPDPIPSYPIPHAPLSTITTSANTTISSMAITTTTITINTT